MIPKVEETENVSMGHWRYDIILYPYYIPIDEVLQNLSFTSDDDKEFIEL